MKQIEIMMHEDRNVRLTGYLQEVGGEYATVTKRPAVIVLPGGGYGMCSDREADPIALEFAHWGYQAFILRYTVRATEKELIWPHPIEDYDEAWELIQQHADEWHVDMDRIATCGFSAGGHLTACTATIAKHRPRAAILAYAAIREDICNACAPNLPYPATKVDRQTPPCYIITARDDILVNPASSLIFASALNEMGINYEIHIYSHGNHGFANAAEWANATSLSRGLAHWMDDAVRFLEEVWGRFTINGHTKPEIGHFVTADYESRLSVDCTVSHLEAQGDRVLPILSDAFAAVNASFAAKGYNSQTAAYVKKLYTLHALLQIVGVPEEQILKMDDALSEIESVR